MPRRCRSRPNGHQIAIGVVQEQAAAGGVRPAQQARFGDADVHEGAGDLLAVIVGDFQIPKHAVAELLLRGLEDIDAQHVQVLEGFARARAGGGGIQKVVAVDIQVAVGGGQAFFHGFHLLCAEPLFPHLQEQDVGGHLHLVGSEKPEKAILRVVLDDSLIDRGIDHEDVAVRVHRHLFRRVLDMGVDGGDALVGHDAHGFPLFIDGHDPGVARVTDVQQPVGRLEHPFGLAERLFPAIDKYRREDVGGLKIRADTDDPVVSRVRQIDGARPVDVQILRLPQAADAQLESVVNRAHLVGRWRRYRCFIGPVQISLALRQGRAGKRQRQRQSQSGRCPSVAPQGSSLHSEKVCGFVRI